MGWTDETPYAGLPLFADADKPSWRGDVNYAMSLIDAALDESLTETEFDARYSAFSVKNFGAVGDGITDDTAAIQAALNAAVVAGDSGTTTGYSGWTTPIVYFPQGVYLASGIINPPRMVRLIGGGQSVIRSVTGSDTTYSGSFISGVVTKLYVENLTFMYHETTFDVITQNLDMSFFHFERCNVAYTGTFIDTGSYADSRSTTFTMRECLVSYGVNTVANCYTDKASFTDNWFIHSQDTQLFKINSLAHFENNVWVPTGGTGARPNKVYVWFSGEDSDQTRGVRFTSERFGGEPGSCPIIAVGSVNGNSASNVYRNQGVTFEDCFLSSTAFYDPNATGVAVRGHVVLHDPTLPINAIQFVKFNGCSFSPDISGGVVVDYNVTDAPTSFGDEFTIEFDESSMRAGTRGANKPTSNALSRYVAGPILKRQYRGASITSGKVPVFDTATQGVKRATFEIDRIFPSAHHATISFILTLTGQGAYPDSFAYGYSSIYAVTMAGGNSTDTHTTIDYTLLHNAPGGAAMSANADIVSFHFGAGETGSNTLKLNTSDSRWQTVSIVFGANMRIGGAYITPLHDWSNET